MPKKSSRAAVVSLKQAPAPVTRGLQNVDGWVNIMTAIGLKGRDKRLEGRFLAERLDEQTCEEMWLGNDMAARIIETKPSEMLREGFEVSIEDPNPQDTGADQSVEDPNKGGPPEQVAKPRGDLAAAVFPDPGKEAAVSDGKEASEAMGALLDEMDVTGKYTEAMQFAAAFGGSGILLGAKDGAKDLRAPLNLDRLEAVEWLTVLAPSELQPVAWYRDPRKAKYGEPEIYRVQQQTAGNLSTPQQLVHESRIIRFDGVKVSRRQMRENNGWGQSVLVRCTEVLRDFGTSWSGAALLLTDFSQAIFKIKNLAQLVANNEDATVIKRAQLVDLSRSICRAILIDSEEDFERKSTSLAGLPDMLDKFALRLAATARMPVTMLMGQAPAGLNATGESDVRWFFDSVAAERERVLRPRLNQLVEYIFRSKKGPTLGVEPAHWTIKFPSLWQLTELEEADLRLKQAQTDKLYVDAQVLMPEEVAISRFGGDCYSTETKLDRTVREAFDVQAEKDAQAEAEQLKALAKGGGQPPPGKGGPPGKGKNPFAK